MEVSHTGELFRLVAVTADNAAAVTEHADDTAVFPVGFTFFVGKFQHSQQIFRSVGGNLIVKPFRVRRTISSRLLDVGHKAGPGPGFELVQQGGCMFCHCLTSTWVDGSAVPGPNPANGCGRWGNGPLVNRPAPRNERRVNGRDVSLPLYEHSDSYQTFLSSTTRLLNWERRQQKKIFFSQIKKSVKREGPAIPASALLVKNLPSGRNSHAREAFERTFVSSGNRL